MTKRTILILSTCFIAVCYIAINILASQYLSPLFFTIVQNPSVKDAAVFSHLIKNQPEYKEQVAYFTQIFGNQYIVEMQKNDKAREQVIEDLKQKLNKNPKSRDLLVELSIAYYYNKDFSLAKSMYHAAKQIDPALNIKELEQI